MSSPTGVIYKSDLFAAHIGVEPMHAVLGTAALPLS